MRRSGIVFACACLIATMALADHQLAANASQDHTFSVRRGQTLTATVHVTSANRSKLEVTMLDHHDAEVAHGHDENGEGHEIVCSLKAQSTDDYVVRVTNADRHPVTYRLTTQVTD